MEPSVGVPSKPMSARASAHAPVSPICRAQSRQTALAPLALSCPIRLRLTGTPRPTESCARWHFDARYPHFTAVSRTIEAV
jgi:hypothetical protein